MQRATNSRYLAWFHEIEKELWRFFACFDPLCSRCARWTLAAHASGQRQDRDQWCCCMIDNQVHDHWESLNALQVKRDPQWYPKLKPLELGRMPGNGPCPALGTEGCQLKRHRPITCTTQLCRKMLEVLEGVGLYEGETGLARQIEDFVDLPDILPSLYGSAGRKAVKVTQSEVERYLEVVRGYRKGFLAVDAARRAAVLDRVMPEGNGEVR